MQRLFKIDTDPKQQANSNPTTPSTTPRTTMITPLTPTSSSPPSTSSLSTSPQSSSAGLSPSYSSSSFSSPSSIASTVSSSLSPSASSSTSTDFTHAAHLTPLSPATSASSITIFSYQKKIQIQYQQQLRNYLLTLASGGYNRLEFSQFKLLYENMLMLIIVIDDINNVDKLGDSALHIACKYGLTAIALKLLERGADLNLKNKLRNTPIDCAIMQGETQLLLALKQAGYISEPVHGNQFTLLPPRRQLK